MDVDHSGGLPDFPDAQVHVMEAELAAAPTVRPLGTVRLRRVATIWSWSSSLPCRSRSGPRPRRPFTGSHRSSARSA
nr:hypothetical protein [Nonomuraea basaltis]